MVKKRTLSLLLIAVVMLVTLVVTACGGNTVATKVTLKDFPATAQDEAKLGEVYKLRRTVKDDKDNVYDLTATVKTAAGADIQVFNYSFELVNVDGYIITYTADISADDKQTSVVTLTVFDDDPPVINIGFAQPGYADQEYTLPSITVSDLSGVATKTVKVFLVEGTTLTDVGALTESGTTFKFVPDKAGIYRIRVTATDNAEKQTVREADFYVDDYVIGDIFNAVSFGAVSSLTFDQNSTVSTLAKTQYKPGDDGYDAVSGYDGGYVTFKQPEDIESPSSDWLNVGLKTRLPLDAYDDFGYVSMWFYAKSASNKAVNFLVFNNNTKDVAAISNTWTQVIVTREHFTGSTGLTAKNRLLSFDLRAANAVTELRIGDVRALYAPNFEAEIDVGTVVDATTPVNVDITVVSTNLMELPDYTLTLKDEGENILTPGSTASDKATFSLIPGEYFYEITTGDPHYHGKVTGRFYVELENVILLPEYTGTIKAGELITIPDAEVVSNETGASIGKAAYTAVYTERADGTVIPVTGKTYTPEYTGTLTVTYTYTNAVTKILSIVVKNPKTVAPGYMINTDKDAPLFFNNRDNNNNHIREWIDDEGGYLRLTYATSTAVSWQEVRMVDGEARTKFNTERLEYDFLHIRVWANTAAGTTWTAWMHGGLTNKGFQFTGLPASEWADLYVPLANFDMGEINNGNYFLSLGFNASSTGNWTNVTEYRIAVFKLVKEPKVTLSLTESATSNNMYREDEDVVFTLSGADAGLAGYTLGIYKNDVLVETLEKTGSGFVWGGDKATGEYKAVLVAPDGYRFEAAPEKGFFIVIDGDVIERPVYSGSVKAGTPITIPDAKVYQTGVLSGDAANFTAVYKDKADGAVTNIPEGQKTFTPQFIGTLTITYTYGMAEPVVLVVEITQLADVAAGQMINTGKDAPFFFYNHRNEANHKREWVDGEGGYLRLTYAVNAAPTWEQVRMVDNAARTKYNAERLEYDYLHLRVWADSSATSTWSVWSHAAVAQAGIPGFQWFDVYIPLTGLDLGDTDNVNYFLSLGFNANSPGNWSFITEYRIGGFELIKKSDYPNGIMLPTVSQTYTAGQEVLIPGASAYDNFDGTGNLKGAATVKKITFEAGFVYAPEKINVPVGSVSYTPSSMGTIYITYEYENALDKTLAIRVGQKAKETGYALSRGIDALADFDRVAYQVLDWTNDTDGGYISWKVSGNNASGWTNLPLNAATKTYIATEKAKSGNNFLHIRMYAVAEPTVYTTWNPQIFNNTALITACRYQPLNEWFDLYIPSASILASYNYLLSQQFNTAGGENNDNIKEIRLAGFEFVSSAKASVRIEIPVGGNSDFRADDEVTFTLAAVNPAQEYTLEIYVVSTALKHNVVATLTLDSGEFVWSATDKIIGTYRARLRAPDGRVVFDGEPNEFKIVASA